jgi:hypothetical protein
MTRSALARIAWSLVLAVVTGCASLPPAKPATDVKAIAGNWKGTLYLRGGQAHPFTSTITEDGRVESIVPTLSNPGPRFVGTVKVEGGKYRFKSETTGRLGTFILHEGAGKRILKSEADDGASWTEAIPAQ